jgi:glutamate dehydrogenase
VVDYFGDEEAIELGPDENMHDSMIELIARQAVKRRYLLGRGVISSKKAGIGHKEYGVTSLGVVTFAEIAMREIGIDIEQDEFSFKITGGPSGDVAGNTLRLLLERCPRVRIRLVIDGSGVLYDPVGIDRRELRRLILKKDIDGFRPEKLHDGGFLLTRGMRRREGMRVTFRRSDKLGDEVAEKWVTADELNRTYEEALFDVPADLFIPAGGRPETIHEGNCQRLFDDEGRPTVRAVVEGANSFITPPARDIVQKRGIVIIRDASANKCGVISSSYEIIANLLMSEEEFLASKEDYVADVLILLEKRARDEAELLFRRWKDSGKSIPLTEISDALSREMNGWYAKLFDYLLGRPELLATRHFRRVLLAHLPAFVVKHPRFRRRTARLPLKYRCAMVASEIAAGIVYRGGWGEDFERSLDGYVKRAFPA